MMTVASEAGAKQIEQRMAAVWFSRLKWPFQLTTEFGNPALSRMLTCVMTFRFCGWAKEGKTIKAVADETGVQVYLCRRGANTVRKWRGLCGGRAGRGVQEGLNWSAGSGNSKDERCKFQGCQGPESVFDKREGGRMMA